MNSNNNNSLQATKRQVDEVVGVMQNNIQRVIEREDHLDDLARRSENMQTGASQFQEASRNLKKKYWWKNTKMILIMVGIVVLLILIIVLASIDWTSSSSESSSAAAPAQPAPQPVSVEPPTVDQQ